MQVSSELYPTSSLPWLPNSKSMKLLGDLCWAEDVTCELYFGNSKY